jgi:hypothetical protein
MAGKKTDILIWTIQIIPEINLISISKFPTKKNVFLPLFANAQLWLYLFVYSE